MKIAYLIPSRGSPDRCKAVIEIARTMASGKHEIDFLVGIDSDDKGYNFPGVYAASRSPSIGSIWNRLAEQAPDAEALCAMGDDSFVISPDWDATIAEIVEKAPISCFAWTDAGSPEQPTCPIVSRGWYNLAGLYTEHFPFWFEDSYLAEVWSFFSGQFNMPIVRPLVITGRKGKTKRLRDLAFWWEFFSSLREERMVKAASMRQELGMKPLDASHLMLLRKKWELRDLEASFKIPDLEKDMAEAGDPGPEYLIAKNRAIELMRAAA